jgi:hypothetical protein
MVQIDYLLSFGGLVVLPYQLTQNVNHEKALIIHPGRHLCF